MRWLGFILLGFLFGTANSRVGIDSALRLAHCRASCIRHMNLTKLSDHDCKASSNCLQCWITCRSLQDSQSICFSTHCVGGCLEACRWISAGLPTPMLLTQPLEELTFRDSKVSWPPPAPTDPTPLYVVMVDHEQYLQTLDLAAPLSQVVEPLTVQVLVVDWRGLTKVFTPRPQCPLELARTLVQRLGIETMISQNKTFFDENRPMVLTTRSKEDTQKKPWTLKEVSRSYHRDLARVHISWNPQQSRAQLMYLVTWQVDGELLRGNLLTNTSNNVLSLASNSVFRVQVLLFTLDSSSIHSEVLVIDTHLPPQDRHSLFLPYILLVHPTLWMNRSSQWELVVAATISVVVLVVLTLAWRCQHRNSRSATKLVKQTICRPDILIKS